MLDYKNIIIKSYALNMSDAEIARQLGCSKSGVNNFLNAFKKMRGVFFASTFYIKLQKKFL